MLFDLEDYRTSKIIGVDAVDGADKVFWGDPWTTVRATRDAYYKSLDEYYMASSMYATKETVKQLDLDWLSIKETQQQLQPISDQYWNALVSLPFKGMYQPGQRFDVGIMPPQGGDWVEITKIPVTTWSQQNGYVWQTAPNEAGEFVYTEMTQELYDSYVAKIKELQAKVKTMILHSEERESFDVWVAPEVPAYALYPEITGYVRGTNSLSIKDAIVRIIDADGVAHEVITDDKGYYKFSNEYIYNNFALTAAGATNSFVDGSFNMFLLDHKHGSTASLYNKTSKFENSFFGAENNRSMTWPVYVKMGRNNRRNFKIEFIPDYSNFPSFSGYVKDAAGNPIKDALVMIKEQYYSGVEIGTHYKNGNYIIDYKYNDFGVDRTILTDENGFYEYTSQMVGEWFNKYGFTELGIPTTIFTEPTRTFESMNRWIISNEFNVYLIPYKQDANSTSVNWNGTPIYDNNDYAASRFEYALSNVAQQFYSRDIEMGQNYVFNVDVVPAVGDEVMVDKIKMTCTPGSKNVAGYIETTTGYCKFVFSNGVSEVRNGWFDFSHSNYGYDTTMFSDEFYVYSCDSNGKALGYITKIELGDTEFSNISNIDFSETEHLAKLTIWGLHASDLDLSGLKKLKQLYLTESEYLESVTGLQDSKYLSKLDLQNTNRLTYFPLENFDWLSEVNVIGTALSSFDISTCGKKANTYGSNPLGLMNVGLSGMEELQSVNFGFIGHKTYSESTDSNIDLSIYNCKKLLVDDVDLLLQQLADSGKHVNLYTDKARSSDSDAAYDTLINRNSYLSFGSEYFESNEEKKSVVIYVDPSFGPDSNNSQKSISLNGYVSTTTGYFRLKSWFDNGNPENYNIYNGQFDRSINVEFDDTFESRPVEIYSTDQYGRPSGSITSIDLNNWDQEHYKNIVDIDLSQATELTSFAIRKSSITSLDLTSNVMMTSLALDNCGKLETIYLDGLVSLNYLNLYNLNSLVSLEGVDTLVGLSNIIFNNCQELDFVSLSSLTSLRTIDLSNVFKYDSTHVDTMLSELKSISDNRASALNTLLANKQSERDTKLAELYAFQAQVPTMSTLTAERDALYTELNQLISDGADQSLIDAKQSEITAKELELSIKLEDIKAIDNQVGALDSELSDLNSQISNLFSGCSFNSGYMARTSASDADYNSLITYGWYIQTGSYFFEPYTLPVKGYITLDWDGNEKMYLYLNNLSTSTGNFMFKDAMGDIYTGGGNSFQSYVYKGILEFWSTDQFGRPGGQFSGLGINNEFVTSVDFDNLTTLKNLYLSDTQILTLDVSNLNNLEVLECNINRKLNSIVGLNLLSKLLTLNLMNCTKLTNVDTSGLESLRTLFLDGNSSLTDIDITTIGSKEITGLHFDNTFETHSMDFPYWHIVELPDGKFMASTIKEITKLDIDGKIDDTFTNITLDSTTNGNTYIYAMEVQADGKVLVGGEFDIIGGVTMSTIARINTDGTIDETFTAGNLLSGPVYDGTNFVGQKYINTIKVQPDGKILIGGFFVVPSVNMYGLVRLNSDGTIDSTFVDGLSLPTGDINGFARLGGAYEDPRVIELQSDGKILVGGSQWNGWFLENGVDADGVPITKPIYRLNSDGTLDTTFDTNNNLSAAFYDNNNYAYVNSIAVDSTGKILVGGWFNKFGNLSVSNLIRLNSDGTLNHDFMTVIDEFGITRSNSIGKINRKSLLFIDGKLFVGAYGRSYIFDENDNISEFFNTNGAGEWNQITGALFTSTNKLIIVGNFSGNILTWPTEVFVGNNLNGIAAFDYGTYNFKSLRTLSIYNQSFETPKNVDVHENITEIYYDYFRTFTSADLDTLLTELDANGQSNGTLWTGYVARTEASDVAYTSLQSKGWGLNLGSYFIGPNEEPAIAYLNFEGTSVNESINFVVYTETNYFLVRYPDGYVETRNGGWISYDLNSSIPASERVFEIYGADQFGRPTDSITYIGNLRYCSSIDVSALKKLRDINIDNNQMITSLNFDGLVSLNNIYANNCSLLETISIIGCTASKGEIYLNSCPQFDIDAFLIQLDQTGSLPMDPWSNDIYADEDWGGGFTPARTSLSNDAAESLTSKGFNLRVVEPAGDSIQIISHGSAPRESWYDPNDYGFGIQFTSSTGYAKIVFEAGSEFNSQYPNGIVSGNGGKWVDYESAANGGYYSLFSGSSTISQKMTIFSCTSDGTPSGEIRYLNITGMARVFGSLSQLTKLKGLGLGMRWLKAQKTSVSLTGMKLEYLNINNDGWSSIEGNNTYISSIDATPILSTLKAFDYIGTFNSNYPGASVTGINFANLERMQIQGYDFGNTTLSGFTKINYLYLDSCFGLSIDFEGSITKNHAAMIAAGYSEQYLIDNPANKQLAYFRISGFDSNNVVNLSNLDSITLPQGIFMNNCNLSEPTNFVNTQSYSNVVIYNTTNITSISGKFYQFEINGCPQITSISINCDELRNIHINNCDSLQSCSIIVNGNYNGGLHQFDFIGCPQLTSVQLNAPYIYLRQLVLNNLPLLSSISISANYSEFYTLNVVNCPNLTQLPQTLFTNALYATVHNTPITVDISNNNRIYLLNLNQVSGVSGLSNKPTLSEVYIWDMNITSLDFSNSFGSDSGSNYSWKYLQLGNISGLTTLNLNNTNLRFLRIQGSTAQNSPNLRTSAMVDSILNALANGSRYGGTFYFPSFTSYTTTNSSAARTILQNRSWMLQS